MAGRKLLAVAASSSQLGKSLGGQLHGLLNPPKNSKTFHAQLQRLPVLVKVCTDVGSGAAEEEKERQHPAVDLQEACRFGAVRR